MALDRVKICLRVTSSTEVLPEIVTSLVRFETLYGDLPESAKQAKELTPDVIEKRVLAVCAIRKDIQRKCKSLQEYNFGMPPTPFWMSSFNTG